MPGPTRDCSIHDYDFSLLMRFCKIKARYFESWKLPWTLYSLFHVQRLLINYLLIQIMRKFIALVLRSNVARPIVVQ